MQASWVGMHCRYLSLLLLTGYVANTFLPRDWAQYILKALPCDKQTWQSGLWGASAPDMHNEGPKLL